MDKSKEGDYKKSPDADSEEENHMETVPALENHDVAASGNAPGENEHHAESGSNAVPLSEQATAEGEGNNRIFHARSTLRKRLRPRQSSPSSSSSDSELEHRQEDPDPADIINTSDDISSTSEDESGLENMHLPRDKDDDTISSDNATNNDASLAWTGSLCKPVATRGFRCLDWQMKRALGSRPNVVDGCWVPRMAVQGSAWMVGRWKMSHQLSQHDGCVNAVNFNESGSLIASGSDDLNVIIWDWAHRRIVSRFDSGHSANVFQSKFLPFSSDLHIVSCARDGQVRLAQLSTSGECRNTRRLGMHRGSAHKLALDPSCPHAFYSCGEDAAVYLFDVREDKPTKLFSTKERQSKVALYSVHANPVSDFEFLTSGRDPFVRTYDRRYCSAPSGGATGGNDRPAKKFCPPHLNRESGGSKHVTCAVFSNDGRRLIGSYNDDDIYMFGVEQNDGEDAVQRFRGHRNYATVKGVNFYGPHSEFVVSGSDCGNVFVWEAERANVVNMFHADDGGVVNVLEPHPHDPVLATSGLDHDVKIWTPERNFPVVLEDLSEKVTKNAKKNVENRKSTLADEADGPLPSIAWILMEALQRERRRHLRAHLAAARGDGEGNENEDTDSDEEPSTDSDEDEPDELDSDDEEPEGDGDGSRRHGGGGGRRPVRIQCAQS